LLLAPGYTAATELGATAVKTFLDPFVIEHAPGPTIDLDPALLRARAALIGTLARLARCEDSALTYTWTWDGNAVDVRYGFYRTVELLEAATSAASRAMTGSASSEARDAVAAATVARWELQGILATLADADLDADPGGGEWTIRRTMQHIVNSQRGYAWGSAYWLSVRDEPRRPGPQRAPEGAFGDDFPEEEQEALGSLADIRREMDDIVDATASRYATLTTDDMQVMSGWSGFPVTIAFRQWRWSSHIEEHTVQVEKTLDMLGRRQTEVQRLVRLIARAYGRLEATAFGRTIQPASAAVFDSVAAAVSDLSDSIEPAVAAAVPAPEW